MHIADFADLYREGSTVISPYGLAVVVELFDDPIKARPERPGDHDDVWPEGQDSPMHFAARIWVNGHGVETIEVDQLVPATPETMARWNESVERDARLEEIADSLEDIVKQNALLNDIGLTTERKHGRTRRGQA
jgi:hypothetical protein